MPVGSSQPDEAGEDEDHYPRGNGSRGKSRIRVPQVDARDETRHAHYQRQRDVEPSHPPPLWALAPTQRFDVPIGSYGASRSGPPCHVGPFFNEASTGSSARSTGSRAA